MKATQSAINNVTLFRGWCFFEVLQFHFLIIFSIFAPLYLFDKINNKKI